MLALVGPTASGKTAAALALAPSFDAEIVNVDSTALYRGMDIGTAKPTAAERAVVPHHLIDVADPGETVTVAAFQALARAAIDDVRARGRTPLLVGGSGLYFRAAVDALEFPPTDPAVRARLEEEPLPALAARLQAEDPDALAFVDVRNERRVVRALEVIELTGRPFSSFRAGWGSFADLRVAGLEVPQELLRERVEARARAHLAEGFLDEVRALIAAGHRDWLLRMRAVSYVQAIDLIEGRLDEDSYVAEVVRANRKLARKQVSWFRGDPRVRWFDASHIERATEEMRAYYGSSTEG